jgi:hypothetical protein
LRIRGGEIENRGKYYGEEGNIEMEMGEKGIFFNFFFFSE